MRTPVVFVIVCAIVDCDVWCRSAGCLFDFLFMYWLGVLCVCVSV